MQRPHRNVTMSVPVRASVLRRVRGGHVDGIDSSGGDLPELVTGPQPHQAGPGWWIEGPAGSWVKK
jgi:hypothetical protein